MRKGEKKGQPDRNDYCGEKWKKLEKRVEVLENLMEAKQCHINQIEQTVIKIDKKVDIEDKEIQNLRRQLRELTLHLNESMNRESMERSVLPILKADRIPHDRKVSQAIHELQEELKVTKNKLDILTSRLQGGTKKKVVVLSELQNKQSKNFNVELSGKKEEELVDKTTFAGLFLISGNSITNLGSNDWYQVMLNTVVERGGKLVLTAHITHTQYANIIIGVVDRRTQREKKSSYASGNAVCYYGAAGNIYYGNHGTYQLNITGIRLLVGMVVEMEVQLNKGSVTFNFHKGTSTWQQQQHSQQQGSEILLQQGREFVPYFEMLYKDDSIRWSIK